MGLFSASPEKRRISSVRLLSLASAAIRDARVVTAILIAAVAVLVLVTTSLRVS